MPHGLNGRFFESTRGRIVQRLRRSTGTVEELAQHLNLTDNAIRSHLATLERDGLVRRAGVRRSPGAGKPAIEYSIHPEAEPIFSRAFAPMLLSILDELAEQATVQERESLMRGAGRRLAMAIAIPRAGDDIRSRTRAAVEVLTRLGAEAEVFSAGGIVRIGGCGACPLGPAVTEHPELCRAIESLLTEVVGAPVTSVCVRGETARCGFEMREVA